MNFQDNHPSLLFVPKVEDNSIEEITPFYVSLNVHEITLHNVMLDSEESHNLMPLVIMQSLGLSITIPYKDLFSFYSRKVECMGLINDLVVSLTQVPSKSFVIDDVVVDIPYRYGILLSRSFTTKLRGSMQMDMTYVTISVFGEKMRL